MNISKKISIIVLYFLIVHVYSFVHWHAHEHQNQIELHLSVHPPQFPINDHDHKSHHCHAQDNDEVTVAGNWEFLPQNKKTDFEFPKYPIISYTKLDNKPKIVIHNLVDKQFISTQYYLTEILPQRAPPKTC